MSARSASFQEKIKPSATATIKIKRYLLHDYLRSFTLRILLLSFLWTLIFFSKSHNLYGMKFFHCSTAGLTDRVKTYFKNTSIHGLRYITDTESHWFERVFWLIVCCLSFVGTYFLFVATWSTYINNPISFVTETTYLDWNTTFPAVSICEIPSSGKVVAYTESVLGKQRDRNFDTLFGELVYLDACSICAVHCRRQLINCSGLDIHQMVNEFRLSCDNLISNCTWNGNEFDCCSLFQPLQTQFGVCFTINSMQTNSYNKRSERQRKLDLVSNRNSGPGKLKFHLHENADVIMHAPEDVPSTLRSSREYWPVTWNRWISISFQVTEIVNDPLLEEVPVDQRKCRFPRENPFPEYQYYSYSTCIINCIKGEQLKLCGCVHHMMPGEEGKNSSCSIEGLACLRDYQSHFRTIKTAQTQGVECDCLSSCTEPEYRISSVLEGKNSPQSSNDANAASKVSLEMASLPSQRFIRNVVRTKLDLVVSLGGAAGLFLGASLLSIVEVFYYFCVRGKKKKGSPVGSAKKFWDIPRDGITGNKSGIKTFPRNVVKSTMPGFYPQDYLSQKDLYL